jgi:hypothetical protein
MKSGVVLVLVRDVARDLLRWLETALAEALKTQVELEEPLPFSPEAFDERRGQACGRA